jgi:hypothetical protein
MDLMTEERLDMGLGAFIDFYIRNKAFQLMQQAQKAMIYIANFGA